MRVYDKDRNDFGYDKAFLGNCFGVCLTKRSTNSPLKRDNYTFTIIVEDDENWFVSDASTGSAFWLVDLSKQIQEAIDWIESQNSNDT